ncbi:Uncharacterised protein [Mycobacteroides abscessus subsp. bolletii]|uniref:DoxX family protein n=1 Tax=Mycobacteroides abscessus TaxID=36809 RepID=UPI000926503A|nr:DoxX family protein [Mycobacteroides abscessus]SIJ11999.1 Uncharacterised protein [Mycobacteroides abscessus subsp. bolletii]SLD84409.1 Uncharacterised protein [Mycobacteroides abscessus subsp. bolletii]SLD91792.1 Uncharacterised protein [Mycobacteroides abscessus subsp. bolletii]
MSNDAFVSPRVLALLASFQAVDAAICVQPIPYVAKCLDDVRYPRQYRWIFAPIKAASAVGLLAGIRFPWLAKLTLLLLTVYFTLAVGAHVRARDIGLNAVSASSLLATYGALMVKGLGAKSS